MQKQTKTVVAGDCHICGIKLFGTVGEILEHLLAHEPQATLQDFMYVYFDEKPAPIKKEIVH